MSGPKIALLIALAAVGADLPDSPAGAQRSDPGRGAPIQLAPHRAVYEFSIGKVRSDKAVSGLTGRMVYEFSGSPCDGYTQSMRFVTRTTAADGTVTVSDQRSTSWEDDTGMSYRFQSSQYRDQKLVEQSAGTATRGEGGEDTRIELSHPDRKSTAIGGEAMFPVQHSLKLLEAARRGQTIFNTDFFDGSEGGEKTYVVSAQIGKQMAQGYNKTLPRVGQSEKIDNVQAWPVTLSYFEQGSESKDALPSYEMSFIFFLNGVSRRIVIDNGDYTMKGELSDLKLIDQPPCRR
jgi:hypothetical protein